MSRLSFVKYEGAIASWKKEDVGNGATGQIKKAGWLGRAIKIQVKSQIGAKAVQESINFNRGSLVDWLKSRGYKIDKGNWCCGGDDDETITKLFNAEMSKLETPDPATINALEKKIAEGDTSIAVTVALVTECLKDKKKSFGLNEISYFGRAIDHLYRAYEKQDYLRAHSIKDLFLKTGNENHVYGVILSFANVHKDPTLNRELAEMFRKGIGTEINLKTAELWERKAQEIEEAKKVEDLILSLEKKAADGKTTAVIALLQNI